MADADWTVESEEVYYSNVPVTQVTTADISRLKELAKANPRRRVRLCAHPGVTDTLHEMIIVHSRGNYVRPHRHRGKSESFHIIEGSLVVLLFDEVGEIKGSLSMGTQGNDDVLYYRLSEPDFHTVIPTTELVVFHETTNGPFRREETEFAPWAPQEDSPDASSYMEGLSRQLSQLTHT